MAKRNDTPVFENVDTITLPAAEETPAMDAPRIFEVASLFGTIGTGEIPADFGKVRKSWDWAALQPGQYKLVSVAEKASALSSANSFGKGTTGRGNADLAREPREFRSRTVEIKHPDTGAVVGKGVEIWRIS